MIAASNGLRAGLEFAEVDDNYKNLRTKAEARARELVAKF